MEIDSVVRSKIELVSTIIRKIEIIEILTKDLPLSIRQKTKNGKKPIKANSIIFKNPWNSYPKRLAPIKS